MKTKKPAPPVPRQVFNTDFIDALEGLAERSYASEKLLLETIEQLGLKAEILGREDHRVCYILRPHKANNPAGEYYPCYELRLTGEGRNKVNTGKGWWW